MEFELVNLPYRNTAVEREFFGAGSKCRRTEYDRLFRPMHGLITPATHRVFHSRPAIKIPGIRTPLARFCVAVLHVTPQLHP